MIPPLPRDVARLVDDLETIPGVVAIALGGSRASGEHDAASDWDLAVYYRAALDRAALAPLAERGEVHPPGRWGRIMNGGAWLDVGGARVDVLLRDLDFVEAQVDRAGRGEFDVDALLGYVAGVPTYLLAAERAIGRVLRGDLPPLTEYPAALAETARDRWRFARRFTLDYARKLAARGDVVVAVGQAAKGVIEEAHARLAERRTWVLNEKRIVERAGLAPAHAAFASIPATPEGLVAWVDAVERGLG